MVDLARLKKAIRLADVLDAFRVRSSNAALLDTEQWAMVSTLAGVCPPSEATKQVVRELLASREFIRGQIKPRRQKCRKT